MNKKNLAYKAAYEKFITHLVDGINCMPKNEQARSNHSQLGYIADALTDAILLNRTPQEALADMVEPLKRLHKLIADREAQHTTYDIGNLIISNRDDNATLGIDQEALHALPAGTYTLIASIAK
jgi:hypothetical protein